MRDSDITQPLQTTATLAVQLKGVCTKSRAQYCAQMNIVWTYLTRRPSSILLYKAVIRHHCSDSSTNLSLHRFRNAIKGRGPGFAVSVCPLCRPYPPFKSEFLLKSDDHEPCDDLLTDQFC